MRRLVSRIKPCDRCGGDAGTDHQGELANHWCNRCATMVSLTSTVGMHMGDHGIDAVYYFGPSVSSFAIGEEVEIETLNGELTRWVVTSNEPREAVCHRIMEQLGFWKGILWAINSQRLASNPELVRDGRR